MNARFAGLHEGDLVAETEFRPDLQMLVRYCGLLWFAPPIFFDLEAARAAGLPGPIVPGPLKAGLACEAIERWLGDGGWVCHVRAAHRRPSILGQAIRSRCVVTRLYEHAGKARADLDIVLENEDGEGATRGSATVEFYQ